VLLDLDEDEAESYLSRGDTERRCMPRLRVFDANNVLKSGVGI